MRIAVVLVLAGACAHQPAAIVPDGGASPDAAAGADAESDGGGTALSLDGNRDRLLARYLAYLQSTPATTQSNGLSGATLTSVCELWSALAPSPRDVFLTITHRLEGAVLADGTRALDHVVTLYRVAGGQDAAGSDAGSCGGGEYNRMIMEMDSALHAAMVAANQHQGAAPFDLADIPPGGFWRDSHDLGGPHAPFDTSDETDGGAPRGQTQYFADPTSALATSPLGRLDLETLVDPYAIEMDQDYDCPHDSNPDCAYVFYGPACAPETSEPGVQIYSADYGDFEPAWTPSGC